MYVCVCVHTCCSASGNMDLHLCMLERRKRFQIEFGIASMHVSADVAIWTCNSQSFARELVWCPYGIAIVHVFYVAGDPRVSFSIVFFSISVPRLMWSYDSAYGSAGCDLELRIYCFNIESGVGFVMCKI